MASLYRKYRSRSFDDLYGQDHVVRTLRNAVRLHRVAHAYLFTGPRGTGKTSAARILARAANCLHPRDGNPCNECENCVAANNGSAVDVIEIDAASYTGVDNVRELRERVGYAAGQGGYKVYIIDEVHRLSGQAFDAFLKTLEEPPPHVIFVFASTEPHKVPETIASRCQRFDFRRIGEQDIVARLHYVVGEEGADAADEALILIAQLARGSLRDALGLLDQALAYTQQSLQASDVRAALGLADPMLTCRLSDFLLEGETGKGLAEFHIFTSEGGDPSQLIVQLVDYWRGMLMQTSGASLEGLAIPPEIVRHQQQQAQGVTPSQAIAVLESFMERDFSARFNVPAELSFEMRYVQAGLALCSTPAPALTAEAQPAPQRPDYRSPEAPAPERQTRPPAVHELEKPDVAQAAEKQELRSEQAAPSQPAPARSGSPGGALDGDTWNAVVARMRGHSPTLQAILRSGFVLAAEGGELTVGFLYEFHCNQFADTKKRKLLETVVEEVTGVAYRVRCVRTTRDQVIEVKGEAALPDDDGFIAEASERLRAYHARQMGNGLS